ncbi:hypothetical protein LOC71_21415 [Rhodopirellula sp. JC740]|uniref:Uncharacterized protein n=1 Tax=Rhodopirellula halodulae TaxID=2894198 RepID=A0ABS8NMN6_9BACT|nr:hypothetical protein [Rhodopirellula sp. JC740]MCC9644843.1 hypothetical protein [Rhodopirellula sp. JC740]
MWRLSNDRFFVAALIAVAIAGQSHPSQVRAADSAGASPGFGRQSSSAGPANGTGRESSTDPLTAAGIILREGTRVGPVTGRFVMSGQRWRFIPEQSNSVHDSHVDTLVEHGLARKPTDEDESLLGRKTPMGRGVESLDGAHLDDPTLPIAPVAIAVPMTLVNENLMLDRISRAIEEDPNDDRWTITGTVTEFRDENRLVIETTVRAPMNPRASSALGSR